MSFDSSDFPPVDDSFNKEALHTFNTFLAIVVVVSIIGVIGSIFIVYFIYKCFTKNVIPAISISTHQPYNAPPASEVTPLYTIVTDSQIKMTTIENFLNEVAREKPIRFFPDQLAGFTQNYSTKLGSGGFGTVYKGRLPNGMPVAVKVLHRNLDKRVEEQFMAEIGTIGKTYHINLVRLFVFCFDASIRALVYEYMPNGALDNLLFGNGTAVSFPMLYEIAVGTAKGIRYLHEECQKKIIHYDIKPGNILLDGEYNPKVADFGLAKLMSRDNTHISTTGIKGTPGYATPEIWMATSMTEKCDVYSFGMLLFEIAGRRRNFVEASDGNSIADSEQWFPQIVWERHNSSQLVDLVSSMHGVMDQEIVGKAVRMCKLALWCVQYQPEARPPMSKVVKMLEGDMDMVPPANPFQHLTEWVAVFDLGVQSSTGSSSGNGGTTRFKSAENGALSN